MLSLLRAHLMARPLTTALNLLLVALGVAVMTVVTLVTIQWERRIEQATAGIDLVVGAQGSPLQLVLAGIHHLDLPTGNIPVSTLTALRAHRWVAQAVPLALGDTLGGYRIVGTEPAYLALYSARLAQGEIWSAPMQAVLGARVAEETGLAVGATFVGSHGLAAGGAAHPDTPYRVSGVLAATDGVIDRLVLTSVESVWQAHGLLHEAGHEAGHDSGHGSAHPDPAEEEGAEITLVLIRYASPLAAATLPREIRARPGLQAASPAFESARLFERLGPGLQGLRALGWLLLGLAILSVFVALLQSLSDQRRELALMRLLGASPRQLFGLLWLQGLAQTALGIAAGVLSGHLLVELAGRLWFRGGEWALSGMQGYGVEAVQAVLALALGGLAALVPAWIAARRPLADALVES